MKSFRSSLILFSLVLVLGVVTFLAYRQRLQTKAEVKTSKEVSVLRPESVFEIEITSANGNIRFRRRDQSPAARWWVTGEKEFPADFREVQFILDRFLNLKADRLIQNTSKDFSEFGFSPPKLKIGFLSSEGVRNILIGDPTPFGKERFLKIEGDARVFIVSDDFFERLNRSESDFWKYYFFEPRILKTTHVIYQSAQLNWQAEFDGQNWQLQRDKKPFGFHNAWVEGILTGLADLNIENIENDTDVGKNPTFSLEFLSSDGKSTKILFFEPVKQSEKDTLLAIFSGEPVVYVLNRIFVERLRTFPAK